MVWKADSTFDASSADVSMNDKPFSATRRTHRIQPICPDIESHTDRRAGRTCKCLCLLCGDGPEVLQIALIPDEHDDDVRVRVIAQLLQPSGNVDVCRMLGDVVDEECTHCAAVVPAIDEPGLRSGPAYPNDSNRSDEECLRSGDGAITLLTS